MKYLKTISAFVFWFMLGTCVQAQEEATKNNVQENTKEVSSQKVLNTNAVVVTDPENSSDARVTFFNSEFRVGEQVKYRVRDRVYHAKILYFIGNDIAVIEMENGAQAKRYLNDLIGTSKPTNETTSEHISDSTRKLTSEPTSVQAQDTTKNIVQENTKKVSPQKVLNTNAEVVKDPENPADAKVAFFNSDFRVGDQVMYRVRDRVYHAKILYFIGNEIALIEMENGAQAKRYLKDLVKVNK